MVSRLINVYRMKNAMIDKMTSREIKALKKV